MSTVPMGLMGESPRSRLRDALIGGAVGGAISTIPPVRLPWALRAALVVLPAGLTAGTVAAASRSVRVDTLLDGDTVGQGAREADARDAPTQDQDQDQDQHQEILLPAGLRAGLALAAGAGMIGAGLAGYRLDGWLDRRLRARRVPAPGS